VTLPVLHLRGDPYTQGLQHGRALRDQIADNLDIYFDRFEREGKLPPREARERAAGYERVLHDHPYLQALHGLADGSGLAFGDLLALNVRYELLYYQFGVCGVGQPDGCTAFALLPTATDSGHLLLGQNWDWIPSVRGAVVHTRDEDGFETLGFTEAGIVGTKIGLNGAGLGLAINGLVSSADDWSRPVLPFHVRCYDVLQARSLAAARQVIVEQERPCSANFLLAQAPDAAIDIEAAPQTVCERPASGGALVHANHFLEPAQLGVEEPAAERRPHSYLRQARLQALLDARRPVSLADVEAALRDHDNFPDSVCRHENPDDPPEERYISVTSVVMDLHERSLQLTDGPACEHLYTSYSLGHTALIGC
jgi:isopenicillin-N N-acyltransferase-like protein